MLRGRPDWARVTERMDRLACAVPRLRQRVVEALSFPVYCSGAPVEGFYSNSPTAGSAVNTTVISYPGVCNVGVNID
ncbi:MAG: WS/DGAT domain-containing protein, partial [Frankiaceae bacterium]